jgi:glucose/arabinose dehydrogenase
MKQITGWIKTHKRLTILLAIMVFLWAVMFYMFLTQTKQPVDGKLQFDQNTPTNSAAVKPQPTEPNLQITEVLTGLSRPWDVVFLPDTTLLFNERSGSVSKIVAGEKVIIARIPDVYAVGEGGLTGLALDADFVKNRYLYTCMNSQSADRIDVRLIRWRLNEAATSLGERKDIVTNIPSNRSGRHSGCRVRSASDGTLWVGTGDAAIASNPQNPQSLGGKILHVNREGEAVSGNMSPPFDPRIFSYGHRNVQGIVLFDRPEGDVYGYSVEHGSDRDDEINILQKGNFGWAPRVTYVEAGIPMTDLSRFPDAVSAVWSSGFPTIAPSGATQLKGERWGSWENAVAMAVLKGKHVRIMNFDSSHKLLSEKTILTQFGRIRSTALAPDGSMYLTTDNGNNDKIIQIIPTQ